MDAISVLTETLRRFEREFTDIKIKVETEYRFSDTINIVIKDILRDASFIHNIDRFTLEMCTESDLKILVMHLLTNLDNRITALRAEAPRVSLKTTIRTEDYSKVENFGIF